MIGDVPGYLDFDRSQWAALRAATPMPLSAADVERLRGLGDPVGLDEVADVYLPLSRLLNLRIAAARALHHATDTFLGRPANPVPYVLGIAGSVAVGKSTTARVLRALLTRWPDHPRVDLVPTDGFLWPNAVLADRGLLDRKGFPDSYDVRRLVRFLAAVKAGAAEATAPVYSHTAYDIVPDATVVVRRPDVLIVEGLNVLQTGTVGPFVSDFFDFSIFVDAAEPDLERWYVDRFLALRRSVFRDPASYFRRYADLPEVEAVAVARAIWAEINAVNLRENITPTRERADLVVSKGPDHTVRQVHLRR